MNGANLLSVIFSLSTGQAHHVADFLKAVTGAPSLAFPDDIEKHTDTGSV